MKKKLKIRFTYNAPVTLTFVLLTAAIFFIDSFLLHGKAAEVFLSAPPCPKAEGGFNPSNVFHYVRLFVHVLGHTTLNHLIGNLSFILLLGPLLEERYGSKILLLMILVTSLVTGVINACLIPAKLCGASGIVFMMIVLGSITKIEKNEIPLSFVLVVALFIGRELFNAPKTQGVSTVAHIAGGLCGSMFGFLAAPRTSRAKKQGTKTADALISDARQAAHSSKDDEYHMFDEEPAAKKKNKKEDETVIGTLDF